MATADNDGVRLNYQFHGSDSQALPMILSHGFSATSGMWAQNVEALSRDRRVITWDMRGHGASDAPEAQEAYTEDTFCGDLAAVLDAAGAERAIIAGMSLGGYLSLGFHIRHPERVAGLLLVDTGPGFKNPEARGAWNQVCEQTAAGIEAKGLGNSGSPEVMAAHHDHPLGLARAARGVMAQRDASVFESLPGIDVPTLVVVGDRDTNFLRASEYMEHKVPGAERVVISDAGHASNMDNPEEFNQAVVAWLQRF